MDALTHGAIDPKVSNDSRRRWMSRPSEWCKNAARIPIVVESNEDLASVGAVEKCGVAGINGEE